MTTSKQIRAANLVFSLHTEADTKCSNCGVSGLPVLCRPDALLWPSLCEPCVKLLSWAWTQVSGDVTGVSPPWSSSAPSTSLVLITREVPQGPVVNWPFELLVVERKDQPGAFGCPGGKIEAGESPKDAAVRELLEETGLITWPGALESLYIGHSVRGRVVQLFLCRGYYGEPQAKETPFAWKAWPPETTLNYAPGFYAGVHVAYMLRRQIQSKYNVPLSTSVKRPTYEAIKLRLDMQKRQQEARSRPMTEDEVKNLTSDREMLNCYLLSVGGHDGLILEMATGRVGIEVPPRPPVTEISTRVLPAGRVKPGAAVGNRSPNDDDDDEDGAEESETEDIQHEEDENAVKTD